MIKSKKLTHRSVKRCNAYSDYLVFFKLRTDSEALSLQCRTFYTNSIEKLIPHNFKSFWSRANNCTFNNLVRSSASGVAHCLASFFQSVQKRPDVPVYDIYRKNTFHLFELRIEVGDAFSITSNSVINDRSNVYSLYLLSPTTLSRPRSHGLSSIILSPLSALPLSHKSDNVN